MKKLVELELLRKIDEIQRLSNKKLRLTKYLMGQFLKLMRNKSYHYVSGTIGMAYNRFISKDIRGCTSNMNKLRF